VWEIDGNEKDGKLLLEYLKVLKAFNRGSSEVDGTRDVDIGEFFRT
jgi:hypothetical protein